MKGLMMDYPLTLLHLLERVNQLFGRVEIASRMPDHSIHRYTYADFYRRARQLAAALTHAGIQPGDRVATLMWNHYCHLEAYFGIPACGAVVHTLNLRLHPSELAYIAIHAGDRMLIVDESLIPLLEKFKDQAPFERVIVIRNSDQPMSGDYEDYESFLTHARGEFQYPKLEENDAAAMCYTSGTTGRPKGVLYSHRAIVLHSLVAALPDSFCASHRDVLLAVAPMFHVNSHGVPYVAVMLGAKLVLPGPDLDPLSLLELFESEKVTFLTAVPTVWLGILEALDKTSGRWNLSAKLRGVVGGSAANDALLAGMESHGVQLIHAWGMTETTPIGTLCRLKSHMDEWPDEQRREIRCSQGTSVVFVETRAVGSQGEVPWDGNTVGELQVRGPWVAGSYYKMPEEERWTDDGWFCTGDACTIDCEGYVRIVDRTKDMIKSGGEWISSVDLESALMNHPAIREAAVIAVPHSKWGERPLAVVVARPGKETCEEDLRAHLSGKFAKWQLPDGFVFVETLSHTSTGKLFKMKLREQYKEWSHNDVGTND